MKVNKDVKIISDKPIKKSDKKKAVQAAFSSLFAPVERKTSEEEERGGVFDFEDLDHLARELSLRRSMGALEKYRDKVREIVHYFSKNAHLNVHVVSDNVFEDTKRMQLTKIVDDALVELTHTVMNQQKNHIEMAACLDNIKGILINYLR